MAAPQVNGFRLSIDTKELKKAIKKLDNFNQSIPDLITNFLDIAADSAIMTAMPLTRIDTGRLITSYEKSPITVSGKEYGIDVFNQAADRPGRSYAIFNEFGTYFMDPRYMLTTAGMVLRLEAKSILHEMLKGELK